MHMRFSVLVWYFIIEMFLKIKYIDFMADSTQLKKEFKSGWWQCPNRSTEETGIKMQENSRRPTWKWSANVWVWLESQEGMRQNKAEALSEELAAKNFSKLTKDIRPQIQEVLWEPVNHTKTQGCKWAENQVNENISKLVGWHLEGREINNC